MEVAFILVAYCYCNLLNGEACIFQEECRLGQALFLQMLGIGFARAIFYFVAKPIEIVMKEACRVGETTVLIILVNVAEEDRKSVV